MTIRILALLIFTTSSVFSEDATVPENKAIRVAVFQGNGVGSSSKDLIEALERPGGKFATERVTADEIRSGKLSDFDVLIHPGGSGSKQAKTLGDQGRMAVRNFVRSGGGYLGVCGGAYLATNDYDWSLNLIDAKVVDRRHWARGKGVVKIRLSPTGSEFLRHADPEMELLYGQGPLLGRREWDDSEVPNYESLAIYATEIAKNNAPKGIMAGTSAVVRCQFGDGRVFCFSPHPELTDGQQHLIGLAVEWLSANNSQNKQP